MGHIGNVFVIYALISGVAACLFFWIGSFKKGSFLKFGLGLRIFQFIAISAALACLFLPILNNDFSISYVVNHSDRSLPILYKISALWAGPEGYFLCLAWVVAAVGLVEMVRSRKAAPRYVYIQNFITTLFSVNLTVFVAFVLNPFVEIDFTPVNGNGLSPIAQNLAAFLYYIMAVLGFASSFIVFSWVISALIVKDYGIYFLRFSVSWVHSATIFMIGAVFFSGLGSFNKIGHSGFWSWDVFEIAFAILVALSVALLHASIICLDKGRNKRLCYILVFIIFEFSLFFVYMRNWLGFGYSGISEGFRGRPYIFILMLIAALFFLPLFVRAYKKLGSTTAMIVRPREQFINVLNYIIFAAGALFFIGLIARLAALAINSGVSLVGSSYYTSIIVSVAAMLAMLPGALAFKRLSGCDYPALIKFIYIAFAAISLLVCLSVFFFQIKVIPSIIFFIVIISFSLMLAYMVKDISASSFRAISNKRRFYAGFITHMGFLIVCLGTAISSGYYQEYYVETKIGDNFERGGYNFLVNHVDSLYKENYFYTYVDISAKNGDESFGSLAPEIRSYNSSNKLYAKTKSIGFFHRVTAAFVSYDFKTKDMEILITIYPFIWLVPLGTLIIVIGTAYAAFGKRNNNE